MRGRRVAQMLLALVLTTWLFVPAATADAPPVIEDALVVRCGTEVHAIDLELNAAGTGFASQSHGVECGGGDTVDVSLVAEFDPFLFYGVAVLDFGAPSVFAFSFTMPLAPPEAGNPGVPLSSDCAIAGALGGGEDGFATMTPVNPGELVRCRIEGITGSSAGGTFGPTDLGPGGVATYAPVSGSGSVTCPPGAGCTVFEVLADFSLGGDSDSFVLTGSHRVELPTCAGFPVTHLGTPGDDVIDGTPGADVINGLGGNDTLNGYGGDDVICGDAGDDVITGGPGADDLYGQDGNDDIRAGEGDDDVIGGEGNDALFGAGGADDLIGGGGDDSIYGQDDNDTLTGGPGTDLTNGGNGFDTCSAGETVNNCEA